MKRYQGEDIPVTLNFNLGTNPEITGFDYFTTITATCNTANYPVHDLTLNVTPSQITFTITKEMTAQMFGALFIALTFIGGGKTFKKRIVTEITIDKL